MGIRGGLVTDSAARWRLQSGPEELLRSGLRKDHHILPSHPPRDVVHHPEILRVPVDDVLFSMVGVLIPAGEDAFHGVRGDEPETLDRYLVFVLLREVAADVMPVEGQGDDARVRVTRLSSSSQ